MMKNLPPQTRVDYQYRMPYVLGGEKVSGSGVVIAETIVGSDDAYIIKTDAGEFVDVRAFNVRPAN